MKRQSRIKCNLVMAADCSIDQLNKYEETETAMLETSVRMYARLGSPLTHSPTTMRNAHE